MQPLPRPLSEAERGAYFVNLKKGYQISRNCIRIEVGVVHVWN